MSSEDVLLVLKAWATRENTARKNVKRKGKRVFSDTFGLVNSRASRAPVLTQLSKRHPYLTRMLTQWLRSRNGQFPFTSISLNVNYAAARHRDKRLGDRHRLCRLMARNNVGPSAIKAFGRFSGGKLRYWARDSRSKKVAGLRRKEATELDVRSIQYFDGTRAHATWANTGKI